MKIFLSAFTFLFVQHAAAQLSVNVAWTTRSEMPAGTVIYYDANEKLGWQDFSAKPPSDNGITAALTVSGFGYNASLKSSNGKGELNLTIYSYFSRNKSWVKPGRNTPYILTHEQHHFDISHLAAVAFVNSLKTAKFTLNNYKTLLPRFYSESCDKMNKMQEEYDGQTKNGQIKEEQYKWNDLIDERIDAITE